MERAAISKALTEGISRLSRQESVTPFMALLAAFQCVILSYTAQTDIVLGTDLAGRASQETEALIGFFVNLLPLRTDLSGDPTFREVLGRVRDTTLGAYAHQDVPFDKLVEELHPERSKSTNPLVQVLFVHMNTPRSRRPLPGIELSGFPFDMPSKFDLAVFHAERETGLAGTWIYNPDLFDAATIVKMARRFRTVVELVIANSGLLLSEVSEILALKEQELGVMENRKFQDVSRQKLKGLKRIPVVDR
jgi:aspartate racemase